MSYNIEVRTTACPHCKRDPDTLYRVNVTRNVSSIVEECLTIGRPDGADKYSWWRLGHVSAQDALPILRKALGYLAVYRPELKAKEPPNGWGSITDVEEAIFGLLKTCGENPTATIEVSG